MRTVATVKQRSSVDLWVVGPPHEIVQAHREVVREGDERVKPRFAVPEFVVLDTARAGPDCRAKLFLGNPFCVPKKLQVIRKNKHRHPAKSVLTRQRVCGNMTANYTLLRAPIEEMDTVLRASASYNIARNVGEVNHRDQTKTFL